MRNGRIRVRRRALALLIVGVVAVVFAVRLFDLQVVQAPKLNADAKDKRAVPVSIPSVRGDIVDRNGDVFATTDERYDVQLSPKNTVLNGGRFYRPVSPGATATVEVTSKEAFAEIGAITGQKPEEIQKIVDDALAKNKKSDFAYVKRSVDLVALKKLKDLGIPWLTFDTAYSRVYPSGAVAGNIVGFSGSDGKPQAGIEISQNACLTGKDGSEVYERGADGVALPGSVVVTQQAVNGGTIKLTLDRDLNWQAQEIINKQVADVGAEWGYLVIMNAKTGELVAVAENDSVDPNNVDGSPNREARSFTSPYEPGSTFKSITAAALIDQGKATPLTPNLTPSHWEPEPNVQFGDSFVHPPEQWTLNGIMVHSSNVGISMLGNQLSPAVRYSYLQKFGIGQSTKAGMPLEDSGLLNPPDKWDRQTAYNTMFGQGLSSTIVQTAGVYQALANGGVRIPPTLVQSCTSADGDVKKPDHGKPVRAVSEKTASTMMGVLESVVQEGWIKPYLEIPGYRIAGKTGTAEEVDPATGRYRTDYVHSFAGVFPADDPQYVAVASVAFPSSGDGGIAAMTAFRNAAEATIRTFHIPPSKGAYKPLPTDY